jgi:predicted transcriptional regulator
MQDNTAKSTIASKLAPEGPEVPESPEAKYQHYACSKSSVKLTTPTGIRIAFTQHQYMTNDESVIEYLDAEIKAGLNIITKGELLTEKESDPLERLREKHIAEYIAAEQAKKEAIGRGEMRDMGSTGKETMKVATTKDVAV